MVWSPQYADKSTNYSETGLWDCNTLNQILEIPYGRAAGALMVKSGGKTHRHVLKQLEDLSMAQVDG